MRVFFSLLLLIFSHFIFAQQHDAGYRGDVLRGEVWIALESINGLQIEEEYPLNIETAGMRA
jgi:hypothetical protein